MNCGDLNVYMDQKNEFGGGTLTIELNEQKEQTEYFDRLCDSQILYLEGWQSVCSAGCRPCIR